MESEDLFLSKASIGVARKTARNLLSKAKVTTYPVLIKMIAGIIPDLEITGQELVDEISGMQITYKGQSFIRYNINHSTKRNRFTVAHELGHVTLGHTVRCDRNLKDPNEVEADQFAAELLMPLEMLKKAVKTEKTTTKLAKAFWVSKDAMSIRVIETRIYLQLSSWD